MFLHNLLIYNLIFIYTHIISVFKLFSTNNQRNIKHQAVLDCFASWTKVRIAKRKVGIAQDALDQSSGGSPAPMLGREANVLSDGVWN